MLRGWIWMKWIHNTLMPIFINMKHDTIMSTSHGTVRSKIRSGKVLGGRDGWKGMRTMNLHKILHHAITESLNCWLVNFIRSFDQTDQIRSDQSGASAICRLLRLDWNFGTGEISAPYHTSSKLLSTAVSHIFILPVLHGSIVFGRPRAVSHKHWYSRTINRRSSVLCSLD
jgi:hypothetical protein